MVRESTTDKKRKKSTTETVFLSPPKIAKDEIYSNAISFEEDEAKARSMKMDSKLFREQCEEMKRVCGSVASMKELKDDSKAKVTEERIGGSLTINVLKKLNRLDKIRSRVGRDTLSKEKLQVDSNRLQLQNLIYEAEHLKKEIQKCYQFKSEDEDIALVSVEEFYANAPESISRPEETKTNEHALRLARLEWELEQRKEYAKLCKEMQESKEKEASEIVLKKEKLDSLAPKLGDLLKATRPIQEILDMKFEKAWEIKKLVRLLPQPLYIVYFNICAYAEVADKYLTCTIDGDEDEARQLVEENNSRAKADQLVEKTEESENENEDNDEEPVSKNRHKRQSKMILLNHKRDELFKHHPLSVTFNVNSKNNEENLSITLIYVPALNFITVQCKLNFDSQSIAAGDIITQDRILSSLCPDDFGDVSPNPKTKFQLEAVSLNPKDLIKLLEEKKLGKPYQWAQRLCGLDFVYPNPNSLNYDLCQDTIPKLMKQIRTRLQARMKLFNQIQSLEIGKISTDVKVSSILQQFVALTFAEYRVVSYTHKFIEKTIVGPADLFYRAIITRGSAKLECYISVASEFPNELPLFAICLHWNDKKMHSGNNGSIRNMEYWINSFNDKKAFDNILPLQLQKAMTSLDIYLETEASQHESPEFTREKIYYRSFRGRDRARPFKIMSSGSQTFYKQI